MRLTPSPPVAAVALLAVACSGGRDPILDRAAEMGAGGEEEGAPPPAPTTRPQPQPGQADPPPGQADPPPGQADPPPPGVPDPPDPAPAGDGAGGDPGAQPATGPQVTLSGTVTVPGWKGGPIRIDVFDGDQQAAAGQEGPRPGIVAVARLDAPGAFSLTVPATTPQVWVGGFVDEDQDGRPGHSDPSGWYGGNPVDVADGAAGIALTLAPPPPPPGE